MLEQRFYSVLLFLVVSSSLILAIFTWPSTQVSGGFDNFLQVWYAPTLVTEALFVLAVFLSRWSVGGGILTLTREQLFFGLVLFGFVAWRSFTSDFPWKGIYGTGWLIHILFFYALIWAISKKPTFFFEDVIRVLTVTVIICVALYWLDLLVYRTATLGALPNPMFSNVRHITFILSPAIAGISLIYLRSSASSRLLLLGFFAAWFYVFLTGGRGGFLAGAFGFLMAIAIDYHRARQVNFAKITTLCGCIVIAIICAEFSPNNRASLLGRDLIGPTDSFQQFSSARDLVWARTVELIAQEPWIGNGPAAYIQIQDVPRIWFAQPHSIIFQLPLHWGILGTILILIVPLTWRSELLAAIRLGFEESALPILVCATMFVHGLVDGGLFYPFSVALFLVAIAQIVGIGMQLRQNAGTFAGSNF